LVLNGQFALYAKKTLASKQYYKEYLSGKIDSAKFRTAMAEDKSLLDVEWFNEYNLNHVSLMPPDEKLPTEAIVKYLAENGAITDFEDMYGGFDEYRKYIQKNYDHGEFLTFIYPEDEILLYAVAKITQPKNVFVAGSYYGYFAIWAMKTVSENGGTAVLSDINDKVCELAKKNFDKLGFGDNTKIYCEDSEALLLGRAEPIDMLVFDAAGRYDDPRPEYRGKQRYAPFLRAARRLLKKDSVIVVHNMDDNPEMKPFADELQSINAVGTIYKTFNGLGVYVCR
jgi:predicted O-methyltransferase YrrM